MYVCVSSQVIPYYVIVTHTGELLDAEVLNMAVVKSELRHHDASIPTAVGSPVPSPPVHATAAPQRPPRPPPPHPEMTQTRTANTGSMRSFQTVHTFCSTSDLPPPAPATVPVKALDTDEHLISCTGSHLTISHSVFHDTPQCAVTDSRQSNTSPLPQSASGTDAHAGATTVVSPRDDTPMVMGVDVSAAVPAAAGLATVNEVRDGISPVPKTCSMQTTNSAPSQSSSGKGGATRTSSPPCAFPCVVTVVWCCCCC